MFHFLVWTPNDEYVTLILCTPRALDVFPWQSYQLTADISISAAPQNSLYFSDYERIEQFRDGATCWNWQSATEYLRNWLPWNHNAPFILICIECQIEPDPNRRTVLSNIGILDSNPTGSMYVYMLSILSLDIYEYVHEHRFRRRFCAVPGLTTPVSCPSTTTRHVSASQGSSSGAYAVGSLIILSYDSISLLLEQN
jgi:hypothetical protein